MNFIYFYNFVCIFFSSVLEISFDFSLYVLFNMTVMDQFFSLTEFIFSAPILLLTLSPLILFILLNFVPLYQPVFCSLLHYPILKIPKSCIVLGNSTFCYNVFAVCLLYNLQMDLMPVCSGPFFISFSVVTRNPKNLKFIKTVHFIYSQRSKFPIINSLFQAIFFCFLRFCECMSNIFALYIYNI